jgi:hypothetical protein
MPMNSTSQSPGQKVPLGSEPNEVNNRTLYATLVASASIAFGFTLLLYYALSGRSPGPRLAYGIFVSVVPALAALLVLKLTKASVSWRGAAIVYLALFVLLLIIQAFGRMIPVH